MLSSAIIFLLVVGNIDRTMSLDLVDGLVWLHSFEKNFYKPDERVIKRDQSEIDTWMLDNACTLQGNDLPRPVFAFDEIGFPSQFY
uniref:DDE_3 domain-containing protein n=1 Tax=Globodera pallida TaxID=36090 RepID=A0A183BNK9_GLOPA